MKRIAVYGGTFDPITLGHWYMIETALKLFDELIIGIAVNPGKNPWFTKEEREKMITDCLHGLEIAWGRVSIKTIPQNTYLVNYAKSVGANFLIRGLRNEADFGYENSLRLVNLDIQPEVETVFLMPPREVAQISSSTVKSLIGPEGWEEVVKKYVPEKVFEAILRKRLP